MPSRAAVITALAITLVGSLYLLYTPSSATFHMSTSGSAPSGGIPGLEFKLSQISKDPPSVLVTLKNTHPSTTFTVLKWSTPLDPNALNLGVFKLTDVDSKEEITIDRLMINRMMPPSRDDLQEISPGTEHATEVVFDRPWMHSKKPAKYQVKAEGEFKAVWEKPAGEITAKELEELFGGGSALNNRQFETEEVVVAVE
ncbi:hypothetical protein BCR34DRAFT_494395 [Clohesyomyces aquaticus]|uniref:Uncharacterized protein n=1 Tax=Clohesyomyces aquaticus TaxID=1231657 RepID=A0A1Y1YT45_9PLEO|nr:hypothetical protein BCR34DRAFT_494395 [Clohesyomyces aquaticus]